jgi:hypothetical protein
MRFIVSCIATRYSQFQGLAMTSSVMVKKKSGT